MQSILNVNMKLIKMHCFAPLDKHSSAARHELQRLLIEKIIASLEPSAENVFLNKYCQKFWRKSWSKWKTNVRFLLSFPVSEF